MEILTLTFQILGVITFMSLLLWGGWELILKGEFINGMQGVFLVITGVFLELLGLSLITAYVAIILEII